MLVHLVKDIEVMASELELNMMQAIYFAFRKILINQPADLDLDGQDT